MTALIAHYANISKLLLRVPTYLLLCLYLIVGILSGIHFYSTNSNDLHFIPIIVRFICCIALIALWYMNGTALNDYADYEIDLINLKNDKNRPLITKQATRTELANLAIIYAGLAIGLSLFLTPWHTLILIVLLLLNYAYSMKPIQISRRGGIAPLLLPLGYVAMPYLFGYYLIGTSMPSTGVAIVGALYLQFIGRIILKDYRDVKGDAVYGKKTFLLTHGNSAVCIVSATTITASCFILLYYINLRFLKFPLIALTAYAVAMLYSLSKTKNFKQQKPILAAFGRAMTGVTVILIAGLIAFIWQLTPIEAMVMGVVLFFIYIHSAQQAFIFNTNQS